MTVPDHHESSMKLLKRAPGINSSFTAQQKVSAGMMKSSTSSMSWYLHAVHGGPQYDTSLGHYYTLSYCKRAYFCVHFKELVHIPSTTESLVFPPWTSEQCMEGMAPSQDRIPLETCHHHCRWAYSTYSTQYRCTHTTVGMNGESFATIQRLQKLHTYCTIPIFVSATSCIQAPKRKAIWHAKPTTYLGVIFNHTFQVRTVPISVPIIIYHNEEVATRYFIHKDIVRWPFIPAVRCNVTGFSGWWVQSHLKDIDLRGASSACCGVTRPGEQQSDRNVNGHQFTARRRRLHRNSEQPYQLTQGDFTQCRRSHHKLNLSHLTQLICLCEHTERMRHNTNTCTQAYCNSLIPNIP